MQIWDTVSMRLIATIPGQPTLIMSVAFSPDGRQLAWGTTDSIRNLDVSTERLILNSQLSSFDAGEYCQRRIRWGQ